MNAVPLPGFVARPAFSGVNAMGDKTVRRKPLILWMGQPVEELTRDELIDAIFLMMKVMQEDRENHRRQLDVISGNQE